MIEKNLQNTILYSRTIKPTLINIWTKKVLYIQFYNRQSIVCCLIFRLKWHYHKLKGGMPSQVKLISFIAAVRIWTNFWLLIHVFLWIIINIKHKFCLSAMLRQVNWFICIIIKEMWFFRFQSGHLWRPDYSHLGPQRCRQNHSLQYPHWHDSSIPWLCLNLWHGHQVLYSWP